MSIKELSIKIFNTQVISMNLYLQLKITVIVSVILFNEY